MEEPGLGEEVRHLGVVVVERERPVQVERAAVAIARTSTMPGSWTGRPSIIARSTMSQSLNSAAVP